jgi:hypothetical protein
MSKDTQTSWQGCRSRPHVDLGGSGTPYVYCRKNAELEFESPLSEILSRFCNYNLVAVLLSMLLSTRLINEYTALLNGGILPIQLL